MLCIYKNAEKYNKTFSKKGILRDNIAYIYAYRTALADNDEKYK